MKFTPQELELRRPLWLALSTLYLDSEPDWAGVAGLCASSPFTLAELAKILFWEVHPVVRLNLWQAVPVWDGFDDEWLTTSILARSRPLLRWVWFANLRYPWRKLKPLIIAARREGK